MAEPQKAHKPEHSDWRITVILILTGVVVALVGFGTPVVIRQSNTTQAVLDGTDLAGCRSEFNSQVTDARTAFDVARAERDTAATELSLLTNTGLQAAVAKDQATLTDVFERLPAARDLVDQREEAVVEATAHLHEVSATYVDAVQLSRSDPKAFLAHCAKAL